MGKFSARGTIFMGELFYKFMYYGNLGLCNIYGRVILQIDVQFMEIRLTRITFANFRFLHHRQDFNLNINFSFSSQSDYYYLFLIYRSSWTFEIIYFSGFISLTPTLIIRYRFTRERTYI